MQVSSTKITFQHGLDKLGTPGFYVPPGTSYPGPTVVLLDQDKHPDAYRRTQVCAGVACNIHRTRRRRHRPVSMVGQLSRMSAVGAQKPKVLGMSHG
jgi:hypothetical protein